VIEQAKWFEELTRGYEVDPEYQAEYLKLVFGAELGKLMEQQGVSQAELARRIGCSRAYVTRVLRSNLNPTLETLTKLAIALGARVSLHLHPRDTVVQWTEVPARRARPARPLRSITYPSRSRRDEPVVADKPATRLRRKRRDTREVR
jgi:transcriptional regulator with XRE-family HTH domain